MGIIVIVPPRPPHIVVRINDIAAFGTFHVSVGKQDIRTEVVAVAGNLRMPCRILALGHVVGGVVLALN